MKQWPKVSVVMSNYNGLTLKLLPENLSSILENDYPNLEVILIDNASTDNTVEVVQKKFKEFKKLKVIRNHINMYSLGLNLGVQNAQGKYVAFFNNDVRVEDGFFQNFIQFLEKNTDIALAQGKLVSHFNHDIIDSVGENMDKFGNPTTIGQGKDAKTNYLEVFEVLSVSGSCSILRKSVIDKIGWFDDAYGIGYEDLDLAFRSWLEGFRVVYFPDAISYHRRAATDLSPMVRAIVRWHFNKNRLATMIKNYPLGFLLITLPVTLILYVAAGLWEIIFKGNYAIGSTRFSAIIWIIAHLPILIRKRSLVKKNSKEKEFKKIKSLLSKDIIFESFFAFLKVK